MATDERITNIAIRARANWVVANDLTASIDATSSRTRIFTFLGDASQVVGTVRVGNTLGFTGHVGITKQAGQADANVSIGAFFSAFGVCSTRIRGTNVFSFDVTGFSYNRGRLARRKWIARKSGLTDTDRNVIGDATLSIGAYFLVFKFNLSKLKSSTQIVTKLPQASVQGFSQRLRTQVRSRGQSVFNTHSGRHEL